VHLVRRRNGPAAFERFLRSYREHPAGAGHELVILFKGFGAECGAEYDRLLDGVPHQRLFLADRGFDLKPYFAAVQRFDYRYFCFFNSFSRILAADWLAKLYQAVAMPGVGLAGATGSYQSFATGHEERARELAKLGLGARLAWRVRHIAADPSLRGSAQRAAAWVLGAAGLWKPARHFPAFPNYHVRTNAFIAARDMLTRIRLQPMLFKLSAFALESGKGGITAQFVQLGLAARVVDRTGTAYERERWHLANVFRQARQEDLLVADNQSDAYDNADAATRADLSRQAWGRYARPA